jgi:flagellar biosynthesis protein FlhB
VNLQLFSQERTEEATPRRREDARKKGQVFKSMELVGAASLLGSYLILKYAGPFMAGRVFTFAQRLWEGGAQQDWSEAGVHKLLVDLFLLVALVVAPVLAGAAVVGLVGNVVQVGFLFTMEPLLPSFDRINPFAGLKRVFSRRALAEMAKSILKMTIIGYVAYATVAGDLDSFPVLLGLELNQVVVFLTDLVSRLMLRVGLAMLVMALADYFYQRWEYEQSIRMSKQEIKEEFKQMEGNPEVRSKIRQRQREMARQRQMQDVQKADVVVTNPTHFAVALAYKTESMPAPRVLAKGQGLVALRIRELAKEADVPIVENKPLTRELHRLVEVGQEVPGDLYQAVAEVLAFVYQLKQKGF